MSEDKSPLYTNERSTMGGKKDNFAIFAFYVFGLGMLLPWNALLAAMDFFKEKYPEELGY